MGGKKETGISGFHWLGRGGESRDLEERDGVRAIEKYLSPLQRTVLPPNVPCPVETGRTTRRGRANRKKGGNKGQDSS